jgi:hypothetical protein
LNKSYVHWKLIMKMLDFLHRCGHATTDMKLLTWLQFFLFGSWGVLWVCVNVVMTYIDQDDTSFMVIEFQIRDDKFMFASHDTSYKSIEDSNYVFGMSSRIDIFNGKFYNMCLSLNCKKWYLDSQLPVQELGLEFPNVQAMKDLLYHELYGCKYTFMSQKPCWIVVKIVKFFTYVFSWHLKVMLIIPSCVKWLIWYVEELKLKIH